MAPHSSILAWKLPWMEEPGRLRSMGSLRVRHDCATSFSLFTFMHWKRKWQATPVFLPGESWGQGALWAVIYGVAQSWTQPKWLSSSSTSLMPSLSAYCLTWVSLTLDVGYLFMAVSAKHSHCSFGGGVAPLSGACVPSQPRLCTIAAACTCVLSGRDKIGIITTRIDKKWQK